MYNPTDTRVSVMSSNPYESSDTVGEPPPQKTGRWGRRLVELLAVIAVVVVVLALLLPAVRFSREPERRTQCGNNLKQIAMALLNYEAEYGALPPAYTVDAEGQPLHSWRTLILPYLEHQTIYDKIDLSKPWNDPANSDAYQTELSAYQCPSAACPANHTTYLAVVAPNGCFRPGKPRKLSEFTDDLSMTLMVIDVDADRHVHWMAPTDVREQQILELGTAAHLPHRGGFQAAFVSGDVRFLSLELDAAKLRALISIAGQDDAVVQAMD